MSKEESHRIEMTKKGLEFCKKLERKGIEYNYCIRHKESKGCVDYTRYQEYLGDYAVGKHLLVQEKKGRNKKYLIIIDSSEQVDLKILKEYLECKKLEFINPIDMEDLIKATPGNISIFNLIYDTDNEIELVIDEELLTREKIAFHPLYNGMSVFIKPIDCFKFLDTINKRAIIIKVPKKEEKVLIKE